MYVHTHSGDMGPCAQLAGTQRAHPLGICTQHIQQAQPTNPTMTATLQMSKSEVSWGRGASPCSDPEARRPKGTQAREAELLNQGQRPPCDMTFSPVHPASGPSQPAGQEMQRPLRGGPARGQALCTRGGDVGIPVPLLYEGSRKGDPCWRSDSCLPRTPAASPHSTPSRASKGASVLPARVPAPRSACPLSADNSPAQQQQGHRVQDRRGEGWSSRSFP